MIADHIGEVCMVSCQACRQPTPYLRMRGSVGPGPGTYCDRCGFNQAVPQSGLVYSRPVPAGRIELGDIVMSRLSYVMFGRSAIGEALTRHAAGDFGLCGSIDDPPSDPGADPAMLHLSGTLSDRNGLTLAEGRGIIRSRFDGSHHGVAGETLAIATLIGSPNGNRTVVSCSTSAEPGP